MAVYYLRHYPAWRMQQNADVRRLQAEFKAEQELKARAALEKQRRENIAKLIRQASLLDRANQIRTFVGAVCDELPTSGDQSKQISKWASWALSEADRIDPVKNGIISEAMNTLDKAFSGSD